MINYVKTRIKLRNIIASIAITLCCTPAFSANAKAGSGIPLVYIDGGDLPAPSYQLVFQPVSIAFMASELANFAGNIGIANWLESSIPQFRIQEKAPARQRRFAVANFFGSEPVPFAAGATRRKWEAVKSSLDSYMDVDCSAAGKCAQRISQMHRIIDTGRNAGLSGKLEAVNATVNSLIHYKPDSVAGGKIDNWASPADTIRRGAGDCEDYAILKLAVLKDLGVPMDSMSIVILRDTRRNLYHAVLAVSTNRGHLILDNMRARVFRDTAFADYKPLYSFSADHSWIHGTRKVAAVASLDNGDQDGDQGGWVPDPANVDRSVRTASVAGGLADTLHAIPVE